MPGTRKWGWGHSIVGASKELRAMLSPRNGARAPRKVTPSGFANSSGQIEVTSQG